MGLFFLIFSSWIVKFLSRCCRIIIYPRDVTCDELPVKHLKTEDQGSSAPPFRWFELHSGRFSLEIRQFYTLVVLGLFFFARLHQNVSTAVGGNQD